MRPTSDRAREAIFASLGAAVIDARVLDLFAGSGALGLEALSRGASSCHFVERNAEALEAVRTNLETLGESEHARVEQLRWTPVDVVVSRAFASLAVLIGLAVWISGRIAAALWVIALAATGSMRPLLYAAFGVGRGHLGDWLRGKWELLCLLPTAVRARRIAQRGRTVPDRELLIAAPVTLNPGLAEKGAKALLRRSMDRFFAIYWGAVRRLCG